MANFSRKAHNTNEDLEQFGMFYYRQNLRRASLKYDF